MPIRQRARLWLYAWALLLLPSISTAELSEPERIQIIEDEARNLYTHWWATNDLFTENPEIWRNDTPLTQGIVQRIVSAIAERSTSPGAQLLERIFYLLALDNPMETAKFATSLSQPDVMEIALPPTLFAWAYRNGSEALEWTGTEIDPNQSHALSLQLVRAFALNIPTETLEFVENWLPIPQRRTGRQAAIRAWAETDAQSAIEWALRHLNQAELNELLGREPNRGYWFPTPGDSNVAMVAARTFGPKPELNAQSDRLLTYDSRSWRVNSPWNYMPTEDALELASKLDSEALRINAFRAIGVAAGAGAQTVADLNPDRYSALNDSIQRRAFIRGVALQIRHIGHVDSLEFYDSLPLVSDRKATLDLLVNGWALERPLQAVARLENLDSHTLSKSAAPGMLESWARHDPEAAFQWALNAPNSWIHAGAIANVFQHWAVADPTTALAVANQLSNHPNQLQWIRSLARSASQYHPGIVLGWLRDGTLSKETHRDQVIPIIAQLDPQAALDWMLENGGATWSDAWTQTISAYGMIHPRAAIEIAERLGPIQYDHVLRDVFFLWLTEDKDAMLEWLEKDPPSPLLDKAIPVVAQEMVSEDPSTIRRFLDSFNELTARADAFKVILRDLAPLAPNDAAQLVSEYELPQDALHVVSLVGSALASESMNQALQWASQLTDRQVQGQAYAGIVPIIAKTNPQQAAEAFNQLSPSIQSKIIPVLVNSWTRENPETALEFIETIPSKSVKDHAYISAVKTWFQKAPDDAIAWLRQLDNPTLQARLLENASFFWVDRDPQELVQFVQSLPERPTRDAAMSRAINHWASRNLPAATEFVKASPDLVNNPRVLQTLLQHWANKDLVGALKLLRDLDNEEVRAQALSNLHIDFSESSSEVIREWIRIIPSTSRMNHDIHDAFQSLGERKQLDAISIAADLGTIQDRTMAIQGYFRGWSLHNPQAAYQYIDNNELPIDKAIARRRVMATWANERPNEFVQWIRSLTSEIERANAFEAGSTFWASHDLQEAKAFAMSLPASKERDAALLTFIPYWANQEPEAMWDFLLNQPPGEFRTSVLLRIFTRSPFENPVDGTDEAIQKLREENDIAALGAIFPYLIKKPELAIELAEWLPQSAVEDRAIRTVAAILARDNLDIAIEWIHRAEDSERRKRIFDSIHHSWSASDPEGLRAFVKEHPELDSEVQTPTIIGN